MLEELGQIKHFKERGLRYGPPKAFLCRRFWGPLPPENF